MTKIGQVKLADIQDAIDVRDPHQDAIGRNQTILTEISGEIPTDDDWVRYSYATQSQEVDIFEPMQDPGYSGTFDDLLSFFRYIRNVAREMSGRFRIQTKSSPKRSERGRPVEVMAIMQGEDSSYDCGPDSEEEDESQDYGDEDDTAEVHVLSSTQLEHQQHGIHSISDIMGVRKVNRESVISSEEWKMRSDGAKDVNGNEQKFPSSFPAMAFVIKQYLGHTALMARLLGIVREAAARLYLHIKVAPMEIYESDMMGCKRAAKNHFLPKSHTEVICTQRKENSRPTAVGMQDFLQKYALKLSPEFASKRCQASQNPTCKQGNCHLKEYSGCPEQKQHYYKVHLKEMLIDEFEVLTRYTTGDASRNPAPDQLTPQEVKELVLAIVMHAFTLHWANK